MSEVERLARRFPSGFLFGAATAAYQIEATFQDQTARGQLPDARARHARASIRLGDLEAAATQLDHAEPELLPGDWESIQQARVAEAELAAARGDVDGASRMLTLAFPLCAREA